MSNMLSRALSRRDFLKNFSTSSASMLLAPNLAALMPWVTMPVGALRVGLLMPSFSAYPQVGASFLDGVRLFQSQTGMGHALRLLEGAAHSPSGLTAQALAQLCEMTRPDVVVSLANPSLTDGLYPYLEQADIPLLISHAGANRIDKAQANVFYNTLGYWQASFRAGAWAAETLGRRAVVVASFYESGYDALHAFEEGLEQAGGQVLARHVTHVPGRQLTMADLMRRIAAQDVDFVYAHYSGAAGADFVTAYMASSHTRKTPLLGSTFLLEGALPGPAAGALRNLYTVTSWSDTLRSEENVAFLSAFRSRYGRAADSFAVLGYETAGLLSAAADVMRSGALGQGLQKAQFAGPRGMLALDSDTRSVAPPLYLRQIRWASSAYRASVQAALPAVAERMARTDGFRSGWLNPYLSI